MTYLYRQEFPMAEISPLRRRMIDDMMIRNISPATQQSYIYAVINPTWTVGFIKAGDINSLFARVRVLPLHF